MASELQGVVRQDYGSVRGAVQRTDDGYIVGDAVVTRTGVFLYRNPDGTTRRELRHPDDVFTADSLATLKLLPVTDGHPPERLVTARTVGERGIGTTGETVTVDGRHVLVSLSITREDGVRALESGRRELSLGYRADVSMESGEYNGQPYDSRQRNIRYNHLAIVDRARAGREARVNLDAEDAVQVEGADLRSDGGPESNSTEEGMADVKLAKITLDGIEYDAAPEVKVALKRAQERADSLEGERDAAVTRADSLEGERDALKERVDTLEQEGSEEKIQAAARRRVELLARARKIVGDDDSLATLDERGIMAKVVESKVDGLDLTERPLAYIEARFDALWESAKGGPSPEAREGVRKTRGDGSGDGSKKTSVEDARKRYMDRNANAWKGKKEED